MLLHRKPSSHRLSRISLDYLLLPPRSVLMHDREKITLCLLHIYLPIKGRKNASHQLTSQQVLFLYKKDFFCWLPFICIYTYSAINFQGYCICSVSFYTLFNRFQLPWPLPECLNTTTLFMVSNNECRIRHI